jgi:hypothetical protein
MFRLVVLETTPRVFTVGPVRGVLIRARLVEGRALREFAPVVVTTGDRVLPTTLRGIELRLPGESVRNLAPPYEYFILLPDVTPADVSPGSIITPA